MNQWRSQQARYLARMAALNGMGALEYIAKGNAPLAYRAARQAAHHAREAQLIEDVSRGTPIDEPTQPDRS